MTEPRRSRRATAFLALTRLALLGYVFVLVLLLLSHATGRWPFILFASFTPMLVVFALPMLALCVFAARRAALPFCVLGVAAFWPFLTHDDFIEPTGASCEDGACTTIVMANLRQDEGALNALPSVAGEPDVVVLVELPIEATKGSLLVQYPMGGEAVVALLNGQDRRFASRMAVIARGRSSARFQVRPDPPRRSRQIAHLDVDDGSMRILGVHPTWPISEAETVGRNAYLTAASDFLQNSDRFVIIGDYNMTPWEPAFAQLSGKRAGDPRWIRTWNARGWQSLTIDHARVGAGLELVSSDVLPNIGSDHYPIRVTVRPR